MNDNNLQTAFQYQKLSREEQEKRGILGRLVGKIAEWKNPTRNERLYGKKLWEKLFNDPIFKEKVANRVCYGEIEHPTDGRTAIDPQKIAVCLAEIPMIAEDGFVYGVFDILNTACGKILKTLLDYGSTVAVSSRGQGDLFTNNEGLEEVDPDSYECTGWDVVFIPGVFAARPTLVAESLESDKKQSLSESLNKLIEEANEEDKQVMKDAVKKILDDNKIAEEETVDTPEQNLVADTVAAEEQDGSDLSGYDCFSYTDSGLYGSLNTDSREDLVNWVKDNSDKYIIIVDRAKGTIVNVDVNECDKDDETCINNKIDELDAPITINTIDVATDVVSAQDSTQPHENDEADDIDVEESLHEEVDNNESGLIKSLQEALQNKTKIESDLISLNERLSVCYAKEQRQEETIDSLKESLEIKEEQLKVVNDLKEQVSLRESTITELTEQLKKVGSAYDALRGDKTQLTESVNSVNKVNSDLKKALKESNKVASSFKEKTEKLTEELQSVKKSMTEKENTYSKNLSESNELIEKYKKIATKAVGKYIDSQAVKLGVSVNEIKNKLPLNYSFKDIDSVCESLQASKISINMLPFRNPQKLSEDMNIQIKQQKREPILKNTPSVDDDVDDSLMHLAGI